MTAPERRPLTVAEQRALESLTAGPMPVARVLPRLRRPYTTLVDRGLAVVDDRFDTWVITGAGASYLAILHQ